MTIYSAKKGEEVELRANVHLHDHETEQPIFQSDRSLSEFDLSDADVKRLGEIVSKLRD